MATFILLVVMVIICTAAVKLDWESMSLYLKFSVHTSIDAPRRNINIPWPTKGMGDADYMLAFQHVVMPVAYEFDPDLVISECFFVELCLYPLKSHSRRWIRRC